MGGFAARKALKVVENVEKVLAVELLVACQGIDLLRPLKTTEPLEVIHALVPKSVKSWDKDRYMAADIEVVLKLVKEGKVLEVASPYMAQYRTATSFEDLCSPMSSPTASALHSEDYQEACPPEKRVKLTEEFRESEQSE